MLRTAALLVCVQSAVAFCPCLPTSMAAGRQVGTPLALRASTNNPKSAGSILGAPIAAAAAALLLVGGGGDPAFADEAVRSGKEVFDTKCAACHKGGGGFPTRTLSSADLAKNGMDTLEAVEGIVTKGKRPMPAYGIKSKKLGLLPEEITAVSQYVLDQSAAGWAN